MERKNKIFWVLFLMLIITIALIVTLNIDFFDILIEKYIGIYGYPSVFVFSFLSDAVDQPIGPEVISGFAVGFGLDALFVFILACLGTFLVSSVNYYIGKNFLTEKIKTSCSNRDYRNICRLYSKYGEIELLIAALTPVPYVFSVWLAGAFQMKLKNFVLFGLMARALRIGLVALGISWIF